MAGDEAIEEAAKVSGILAERVSAAGKRTKEAAATGSEIAERTRKKAAAADIAGDEAIDTAVQTLHKLVNQAEELARKAKEAADAAARSSAEARQAAETAGKTSQKTSERAEEAANGARTLAAEAVTKVDELSKKIEKAHQKTVAEVDSLSAKTEEALRLANDALEKIRSIASSLLTQWESAVIIVAAIGAATMLGVGLALLLMNP